MYTTKKVSVPWHVLSYLTVCIRVHYDNDMSLYITASINTSIYIHDIIPWSLKSIKAFTWLEMLWKDFFFTESQSSKIWKTNNYLGIMFRSSSHKKRFFAMCCKRGHATANLILKLLCLDFPNYVIQSLLSILLKVLFRTENYLKE